MLSGDDASRGFPVSPQHTITIIWLTLSVRGRAQTNSRDMKRKKKASQEKKKGQSMVAIGCR